MKSDQHDRDRARDLRRSMNEVEKMLWARLRGRRRQGLKFRRQHPLGPLTADFWCADARVVVEIDGSTHRDRREFDQRRDTWMMEQGIAVLRFSNDEVYGNVESVLLRIEAACRARH